MVDLPALWGFLGAFVYAVLRLVFFLRSARRDPLLAADRDLYFLEFAIACAIGPIFAEGFGPFLGHRVKWLVEPDGRALWLAIGLAANPLAPELSRLFARHVLRRLEPPKDPPE